MDTRTLAVVAHHARLCIGLTVDPTAEPSERWVATVGLDGIAAADTPDAALSLALAVEYHSAAADPQSADARAVAARLGWLPAVAASR